MNIFIDSLRAYESNKRVPPDNVVIKMIEMYNAQYLAYQHRKTKTQIREEFLPYKMTSIVETIQSTTEARKEVKEISQMSKR